MREIRLNQSSLNSHHNPISGKWKLAETFLDYKHNSAVFLDLEG